MPLSFNRTAALLLALSPLMRPAVCAELPANAYPQRPVRVIVSVPPGSGIDTVTRAIGAKLAEFWGRSVVVDNRPGAGGAIAMDLMARSPADGYTLLSASVGLLSTAKALKKISYEPLDAFEPVVQVTSQPYVVMAAPAAPFNSIQELLAIARAKPGSLNYASSGAGSASHLGTELFKAMAKIDLVHVPYKGLALALNDVAAGQVHVLFGTLVSGLPYIRSRRVRLIAVTTPHRLKGYPDVPTVIESGVPGYELSSAYAFYAPLKTPPQIIAKVNHDVLTAIESADIRARMDADGADVAEPKSPAEFKREFVRETARWNTLFQTSRIADH